MKELFKYAVIGICIGFLAQAGSKTFSMIWPVKIEVESVHWVCIEREGEFERCRSMTGKPPFNKNNQGKQL